MIACISPADSNIEESINTLRYAERTRNIKNSAKINAVSAGSSASEAVALRRENQQLKLELARMESKLISSNTTAADGSTGFSFGGLISSGTMGSVLQLQAQCSSLLAEIELLKGRAQGHADEILEASLRADKWQAKSEAIAQLAQSQGVDLSCLVEVASANDDLVSQLRSQLAECKAEVFDARTEAMISRATAGAILAARGDLSNIEHIEISDDSLNLSASEDNVNSENEELTAELTAVSATIEQKEAMVVRMNKERACLDSIHPHYENLLKQLMTEVDALTAERNDLMLKMSADENENNSKRQRNGNDPPMTKRLREQIGKLQCRIDELKVKANEHERSTKMKEEAEKKCARLLAEIAEDKRRRADLQRKLKEASVEMRTEKKAAQQKASKLLKDSQRLKIELTKMKNVAQKQAAVLKRKIDQASAKEKARVELERKRRSAENMRLTSSSNSNPQVNETRKTELSSWVDHEFEYSLIKFEIDDQRRRLENAVADRSKLMASSGDVVCVEDLEEMDIAIRSLRITVQDLETTVKKAFPTAGDCNAIFRFLDTDKFKGLSKHDASYTMTYMFDKCLLVKQEMATILSNQEANTKTTIAFELAKEHQLHEKEKTKIIMEHALATLNLLQSTQDTVNSHIKLNIDNNGVGIELKEQLEGILGAYHANWSSATDALKMHLSEIKETHSDHEAMIDNLTKGMTIAPIKLTTKKKKAAQHAYDSEAFESEESFMEEGDGEDSEYEPTPAKSKQKRRSPRLSIKKVIAPESPASPIGENFVDDIESMKVGTLKMACKKLGVPVTGKKADLMQRVRNHFLNTSVLNSSVASHNPNEEGKKVNFECDEASDPEFRPVDDKHDTTESIKKQLWCETDLHVSDEASHSSTKSSIPSKQNICDGKENDGSMTPGKRARLLGFGSSSPRVLSPKNIRSTPVHLKQT
jgi:DNA repair exonuclease SbcCD ATPase subunit